MNDIPSTALQPTENPPFRVPAEFFAALGYPIRIWIVQQLAQGRELTATDVAAEWKRGFDSINEHCKTLAKAGVVSARHGTDKRSTVYFIPEYVRREPGHLDYGWCRFRVA